jgi:GrpB-like predicted nucleotidyltransferase (UPF0157 family)
MSSVEIVDYNPEWPNWFEAIQNQIWPVVQPFALGIEHVGSTSVPGLAAKPVIDMDIIIETPAQLHDVIRALRNLGYVHRGNLGLEGREAFHAPATSAYWHHLYVCLINSLTLRNHLLVRDHLRNDPVTRDQYAVLKAELARDSLSIDAYCSGKTSFMIQILKQYGISKKEEASIMNANRISNHRMKIHSPSQRAELWDGDRLIKTYTVSTALNGLGCVEGSECTPIGLFKIASKIGEDLPSGSVLRLRAATGEVWSGAVSNPLSQSQDDLVLTRLLWLEGAQEHNANTFKRFIYLHGTNQEDRLGQPASHGCIRFSNQDIIEVFDALQAGDEVEIT